LVATSQRLLTDHSVLNHFTVEDVILQTSDFLAVSQSGLEFFGFQIASVPRKWITVVRETVRPSLSVSVWIQDIGSRTRCRPGALPFSNRDDVLKMEFLQKMERGVYRQTPLNTTAPTCLSRLTSCYLRLLYAREREQFTSRSKIQHSHGCGDCK